MTRERDELYRERENRVQAAFRLEKPDRVPVICSEDAFCWGYAGITMQEFMTDNEKMMMAREKFQRDFEPDMAYFPPAPLDPLTIVVGEPCLIKIPGVDLPADCVFQLAESEVMGEEDYAFAIEKGYMQLLVKLLPKLRPDVPDVHDKFFSKLEWAGEVFASNVQRLREFGVPCWGGGGMESPFGVLTMLRSYEKFCADLYRRPDVVAQTVDRFTDDIADLAIASCKGIAGVPRAIIGFHREGSSYLSPKHFEEIVLPQMKRLVDILSKEGITTILHCDGDWTPNLQYLKELPERKCVLDLDAATDIFKAKEVLGDRMCISGNLMEILLSFGTPAEIEEHCKKLIDIVGKDGGFVMKGEVPREGKPENIRTMVKTARTYRK